MTIEEALREAATRGMTHLSLYPVHSADNKMVYWHARATPSTAHSPANAAGLDPVDVVLRVLAAMPKAPLRKRAVSERPAKLNLDPDIIGSTHVGALAAPVTATVKKSDPPTEDWMLKS